VGHMYVRSTVLLSSRAALQETGHFEAYERLLWDTDRTTLREMIAGVWVPLALAQGHYTACEALGFAPQKQHAMGLVTGRRANGTLLGTIARLAKSVGVTPWALLEQLPRFWSRGFDGGSIAVQKLGPKEARVVLTEQPLVRFAYFRNGLAGTAQEQLKPFCEDARVRVERQVNTTTAHYLYQWA